MLEIGPEDLPTLGPPPPPTLPPTLPPMPTTTPLPFTTTPLFQPNFAMAATGLGAAAQSIVYIYIYICYIYTCIHIHTLIHIHTHIHAHTYTNLPAQLHDDRGGSRRRCPVFTFQMLRNPCHFNFGPVPARASTTDPLRDMPATIADLRLVVHLGFPPPQRRPAPPQAALSPRWEEKMLGQLSKQCSRVCCSVAFCGLLFSSMLDNCSLMINLGGP